MDSCNNCVLYELQEYNCYVWFHEPYSNSESIRIDMMETPHLISYNNDKGFSTSVSILGILTLTFRIVFPLIVPVIAR